MLTADEAHSQQHVRLTWTHNRKERLHIPGFNRSWNFQCELKSLFFHFEVGVTVDFDLLACSNFRADLKGDDIVITQLDKLVVVNMMDLLLLIELHPSEMCLQGSDDNCETRVDTVCIEHEVVFASCLQWELHH